MAPTVMLLSSASAPSLPQAAQRSMAAPAADLFLHPTADLFLHPAARRPYPACMPSISLISLIPSVGPALAAPVRKRPHMKVVFHIAPHSVNPSRPGPPSMTIKPTYSVQPCESRGTIGRGWPPDVGAGSVASVTHPGSAPERPRIALASGHPAATRPGAGTRRCGPLGASRGATPPPRPPVANDPETDPEWDPPGTDRKGARARELPPAFPGRSFADPKTWGVTAP